MVQLMVSDTSQSDVTLQEHATPLHMAADNGDADVVSTLLAAGAAVAATNEVQLPHTYILLLICTWLARSSCMMPP
jgi:ankyrin repeat protein